eukprot:554066_1
MGDAQKAAHMKAYEALLRGNSKGAEAAGGRGNVLRGITYWTRFGDFEEMHRNEKPYNLLRMVDRERMFRRVQRELWEAHEAEEKVTDKKQQEEFRGLLYELCKQKTLIHPKMTWEDALKLKEITTDPRYLCFSEDRGRKAWKIFEDFCYDLDVSFWEDKHKLKDILREADYRVSGQDSISKLMERFHHRPAEAGPGSSPHLAALPAAGLPEFSCRILFKEMVAKQNRGRDRDRYDRRERYDRSKDRRRRPEPRRRESRSERKYSSRSEDDHSDSEDRYSRSESGDRYSRRERDDSVDSRRESEGERCNQCECNGDRYY